MEDSHINNPTSEYESNLQTISLPSNINKRLEPDAEILTRIDALQRKSLLYSRLIYLVAIVSGTNFMTARVDFWYFTTKLKLGIVKYTFFINYTGVMRNFKPLLSFITEIFYPFHSRIRFYIIAASLMITISSLLISIIAVKYWAFFTLKVIQSTGYVVIELIVEGMTAEVVKFQSKI